MAPLVAALLGAAGCATTQQYGYRPTEMVASSEGGFPSSRYVITPQAPRGEVYLTSFGTRDIDAGEGRRDQLVHVRMAVANQSGEQSWFVDPTQQFLVGGGMGTQRPAFMEVDGRQSTTVSVDRGQRRVFDLYYRMPPGADAANLPAFDMQWQVNTGAQLYAQRTPFVREPLHEHRYNTYVAVGPPWWAYWYGSPWGYWAYGGWPYYGYGPYARFGVGYHYGRGYYGGHYGGPRYGGSVGRGGGFHGGFRGGGGGGFRSAPAVRGRPGR
jgi:hypothetical protein